MGNEKGNSLYINPMEGYIQSDKNSRNRKPAISIEEDPSPEPATPEDSPDFPNENTDLPKNKHSSSNSASDGAPNERLNDLSPRRQGRGNSKPTGAINGVPNIPGTDPTQPPAFHLDTDSEDDLLSDGTPLTPLHISEEEDNNERNKPNNRHSSTASMDRLEEKNRRNAVKETNEPKPLDPSELFPVINRNKDKDKNKEKEKENMKDMEKDYDKEKGQDKIEAENEKPLGSSSSSDAGSDTDSSTTTEGCDSPNTLATLDAELGSDPAIHNIGKNNWNERGSPEPRLKPYPQPASYLAGRQGRPPGSGPDARQPRPHGPGGQPPMRGHGPRGPPGREYGQRGPPREPGARGYPPREHRGHGPRGPGQRDPRDPRDPRDTRDPRDHRDPRDLREPRDMRDPRDPRDPGARHPSQRDPRDHRDPRGPGPRDPRDPRDPGARPGPREPGSKGPAPREPGSRVPPHREPGPRDSMGRGPAPRPPEYKCPTTQQNTPPFPVYSNFYEIPPIDKDRSQRLNMEGRNQGPVIS